MIASLKLTTISNSVSACASEQEILRRFLSLRGETDSSLIPEAQSVGDSSKLKVQHGNIAKSLGLGRSRANARNNRKTEDLNEILQDQQGARNAE